MQGFFPFIVVINIHGKHRPKKFSTHGRIFWIFCYNYSRFNKVALAFVIIPASNYFNIFILFGLVYIACKFVKRAFVNNSVYEVAHIFRSSHFEGADIINQIFFDVFPNAFWNIATASGATFLTLIFKGTTGHCGCNLLRV